MLENIIFGSRKIFDINAEKENHYGVAQGPRREPKTNGAVALSPRARRDDNSMQERLSSPWRTGRLQRASSFSARLFPVRVGERRPGKASGREQPTIPPRQTRTTPKAAIARPAQLLHCSDGLSVLLPSLAVRPPEIRAKAPAPIRPVGYGTSAVFLCPTPACRYMRRL